MKPARLISKNVGFEIKKFCKFFFRIKTENDFKIKFILILEC